jgi:Helix-turn-helix domain
METPDPTTKPTLSVDETRAILGWSRSSAYDAVRTGQIPSFRIGRRFFIPTARLREMLVGPEPPPQRQLPRRSHREPSRSRF